MKERANCLKDSRLFQAKKKAAFNRERVRERYSKVTAGDDIAIEIVLQLGQESQESSARKRSSLGT